MLKPIFWEKKIHCICQNNVCWNILPSMLHFVLRVNERPSCAVWCLYTCLCPNLVDSSTCLFERFHFQFRGVCFIFVFSIVIFIENPALNACNVDPDQTPRFWVYTVCQCPFYGTLGMNGLSSMFVWVTPQINAANYTSIRWTTNFMVSTWGFKTYLSPLDQFPKN